MTHPEFSGTTCLDETLIEFSGADVRTWLQGQITNDISLIDAQPGMEACICSPTGHIEATIKLWSREDKTLVSSPSVCVDSILNRVNRFVIMEDVAASATDLKCIHTFGRTPTEHIPIIVPSNRFCVAGFDYWMTEDSARTVQKDFLMSSAEFEALRIESGVPKFGADIGSKTLAPELGGAFVKRTISENKGCYVGQEVIHRIHSRGHTNRTWRFLRCEAEVATGLDIVNDQGEVCGKVTSSAISAREGPIAAGMIKNNWTAAGTALTANGVKVIVEDFPRA
jgi:folate-binding protein YgfZ